jgi:hypothetical protein
MKSYSYKVDSIQELYILHTYTEGIPDSVYRYRNIHSMYRALSCIWTSLRYKESCLHRKISVFGIVTNASQYRPVVLVPCWWSSCRGHRRVTLEDDAVNVSEVLDTNTYRMSAENILRQYSCCSSKSDLQWRFQIVPALTRNSLTRRLPSS